MGAFINDGDGVVCIEPFFDQYNAEILFHGGNPLYVPLLPPTSSSAKQIDSNEWTLDMSHLERVLSSPSTKALILNTPHNPVGKVFSPSELAKIAELCVKYDILVVADEVYDCLTFDGHSHTRIASFAGMWDRTITVGSAGKSFACTGWRVGWLIGPITSSPPPGPCIPASLLPSTRPPRKALRSDSKTHLPTPFSRSRSTSMPTEDSSSQTRWIDRVELHHPAWGLLYHGRRVQDRHSQGWVEENDVPQGILHKEEDYLKAWFIAKICDVVVIPATAFYSDKGGREVGKNYVRFSFCKDDQIEQAAPRLNKLMPYLKRDE